MFVSENTLFKNLGFLEILESVFEQTLMLFISSVISNANQGKNKQTKTPKIHFILAQLALKETTLEQKEHRELSNRYDRVGLECVITVWKGTDTQPG